MPCVLDSSVAIAWALPDETKAYRPWLLRLKTEIGAAPAIWFPETSNSILMAQRRGRIDGDDVREALGLLAGLAVQLDEDGIAFSWDRTFELARSQNLTVYDASYIELAMRKDLPLLTLDAAMRGAAERLGIAVPAA